MQKIKKHIKNIVSTSVIGLAIVGAGTFALAPVAGAVDCAILPQGICDSATKPATKDVKDNAIFDLLKLVLKFMTAGVGIAAVGGIVYAAVLYTSAGDAMDQVKKSKTIITDVVIGLVAYALMFLLLNWLIPGGVLG
jgi:hypothetical protein